MPILNDLFLNPNKKFKHQQVIAYPPLQLWMLIEQKTSQVKNNWKCQMKINPNKSFLRQQQPIDFSAALSSVKSLQLTISKLCLLSRICQLGIKWIVPTPTELPLALKRNFLLKVAFGFYRPTPYNIFVRPQIESLKQQLFSSCSLLGPIRWTP